MATFTLGKWTEANAWRSRALDAGTSDAASAHALRAHARLRGGDLAGADADVDALGSISEAGTDELGVSFPRRWVDLQVTFLEGLVAAERGRDDVAIPAPTATVEDAAAYLVDIEPFVTRRPDGTATGVQFVKIVHLDTTLEPDPRRARTRSRGTNRLGT